MLTLFVFVLFVNYSSMQNGFPIDLLQVNQVDYEFTTETDEHDAEMTLSVRFDSVTVDGEVLTPTFQFVGFSNPAWQEKVFLKDTPFQKKTTWSQVLYTSRLSTIR